MSAHRGDLEGWRAGLEARRAREHAADEVAERAIRAGLDGLLSWAQVEDVLTGLGYGQEPEWVDPEGPSSREEADPPPSRGRVQPDGPPLTEDVRAAAENRAAADYRMTMENMEAARARELERSESERELEAQPELGL